MRNIVVAGHGVTSIKVTEDHLDDADNTLVVKFVIKGLECGERESSTEIACFVHKSARTQDLWDTKEVRYLR